MTVVYCFLIGLVTALCMVGCCYICCEDCFDDEGETVEDYYKNSDNEAEMRLVNEDRAEEIKRRIR